MIDDIAEGLFRGLGRTLLHFFVEVVFDIVCYHVGKPVVRVATVGYYPTDPPTATQEIVISTVGLLVLLAVPLAISIGLLPKP